MIVAQAPATIVWLAFVVVRQRVENYVVQPHSTVGR
jgi:hypothetical protein